MGHPQLGDACEIKTGERVGCHHNKNPRPVSPKTGETRTGHRSDIRRLRPQLLGEVRTLSVGVLAVCLPPFAKLRRLAGVRARCRNPERSRGNSEREGWGTPSWAMPARSKPGANPTHSHRTRMNGAPAPLIRGSGKHLVVQHARTAFQQELVVFGIEDSILVVRSGEGFDGFP